MQRLLAGKAKNLMHTVLFFASKTIARIPQLWNQGLPELSHVKKTVLKAILLNLFADIASHCEITHLSINSYQFCIAFLQKITFEQLCLNPYCGTSPHLYHPHQTPNLSPCITNVVASQIQVCQGRVVLQSLCQCLTADKDLQNTWWNHPKFFEIHILTRNLNAFYRILLILPLILTYHVVSNEMKRTSSNSLRSAWWTWHISAPILCVDFLSLISQFHLRLALSGSILPYLPPSWPIPQHPHHPDQTPSLSPFRADGVVCQIQVCQGRVLLQSLCQCLTANKDVQNTWWNHLRFFKIHIQEISTPSTACSHTSSDIRISCGLQWNEKNKLKFT